MIKEFLKISDYEIIYIVSNAFKQTFIRVYNRFDYNDDIRIHRHKFCLVDKEIKTLIKKI